MFMGVLWGMLGQPEIGVYCLGGFVGKLLMLHF
jgi:hypothetical protein